MAVVEQPPDQRRLAVVDAAAGDEAQHLLGSCRASHSDTSLAISSRSWSSTRDIRNSPPASSSPCSQRPHRGRSPGPAARRSWSEASPPQLPRQWKLRSPPRRSAGSSRACGTGPCGATGSSPFSGKRSSSTIKSSPSPHRRPFCGEIERDDLDLLAQDILPDVELGPVGQGKHPDAFALVLADIVERPQFGTLALRVPAVVGVAEAEDPLLSRGFSPRRGERRRMPRRSHICRAPASALRSSTRRCEAARGRTG
jgi:hypothetical protein